MDWSNDKIIKFLKCYESEPIIWRKNYDYKDKQRKIPMAWNRISRDMGIPVDKLKLKKNSLMATYRLQLRRKKASLQAGETGEDQYEPTWFAYDLMERFLAPDMETNEQNTDMVSMSPPAQDEMNNVPVMIKMEPNAMNSEPIVTDEATNLKRRRLESSDAESTLSFQDSIAALNNMLLREKNNDDCDIYGKLLATKLRRYNEDERLKLMYDIDGLLLSRPPTRPQPSSVDDYLNQPISDRIEAVPGPQSSSSTRDSNANRARIASSSATSIDNSEECIQPIYSNDIDSLHIKSEELDLDTIKIEVEDVELI